MKTIALLPARSASKRIPRKNIKPFCGKPIIAYPIAAALQAGIFDEVVVSTDSQEIAAVARECGASVPFLRPESLSDDFTPTAQVAAHAVRELGLDTRLGVGDVLCVIYPTAALLQAQNLARGLDMLLESWADFRADSGVDSHLDSGADSKVVDSCVDSGVLFSFAAVGYAYSPFRSFCISTPTHESQNLTQGAGEPNGHIGEIAMLFPKHFATRSQDLPQVYHDAGQFYFGWAGAWERVAEQGLPIFAPHSRALILSAHEAQDIDTPEDWAIAEMKYRAMRER